MTKTLIERVYFKESQESSSENVTHHTPKQSAGMVTHLYNTDTLNY